MKIDLKPLKGFRDFYPEDYLIREKILNVMHEVSRSFGYLPYDGPTLEKSSIYEVKSGDNIARDESYTFLDRGERKVSLRPEMTPTLARMMATKSSDFKKPIRLYSIPSIFRNENPQKGRSRESMQYNADILGEPSLVAEIEIMDIFITILEKLGFERGDFEIRVNNRGFMENVLSSETHDSKALFALIDRYLKLPENEFIEELNSLLIDKKNLVKVLEFLKNKDYSNDEVMVSLFNLARDLGVSDILRYDPTMVRGFDYYTGIVFEIWDRKLQFKRAIAGGGRYENLVSLFGGEKLEGVGAAFSDVVILGLLDLFNKKIKVEIGVDYFISTFKGVPISIYKEIADILRNRGKSVIINTASSWSLTKQLSFASSIKVSKVLIIGDKERDNKSIVIKDLNKNSQEEQQLDIFLK